MSLATAAVRRQWASTTAGGAAALRYCGMVGFASLLVVARLPRRKNIAADVHIAAQDMYVHPSCREVT